MSDPFIPIPEDEQTRQPEVADAPSAYAGGAPEDTNPQPFIPTAPNSFYLPLWFGKGDRSGPFLSWQSDNPIAVLALVVIVLILVSMMGLGVLEGFTHQRFSWVDKSQETLGQALLTVIGAIVGATASSSNKKSE